MTTSPTTIQFIQPKAIASFDLSHESARRFVLAAQVAAMFCSTGAFRDVLRTVHVVADGKGGVVLEASDSYRLVKIVLSDLACENDALVPKFDVVIPAKWLIAQFPRRVFGLGVDLTDDTVTVRIPDERTSATAPLTEGKFPNTTAMWQDPASFIEGLSEECAFNPAKLFSVFKACMKWAPDKAVRVRSLDVLKPVRFDVPSADGEMAALLMPVRIPS